MKVDEELIAKTKDLTDEMFCKLDDYLNSLFEFMDGDEQSQILIASLQQDLNVINNKESIN